MTKKRTRSTKPPVQAAPVTRPAETSEQQDPHAAVVAAISGHLERLESLLGYPVITYYLHEGAALEDVQMEHLYEHLGRIGKQERLGVWLFSRGGHTEVPWKIVSLLRAFTDWFAVLIPYRAHSGATHVAIGANEIVMTEMSELGPTDPSRRHPLLPKQEGGEEIAISVQDLRQLVEFIKREMGDVLSEGTAAAQVYSALFDKVHPLAVGALEQSWALSHQISERVLMTHMDPDTDRDKIRAIADKLSDSYKSHRYQINRAEARGLGLPVRDASADEAKAMWNLYLAYKQIDVGGEAQAGSERMKLVRAGHIDSRVGSTLGFTMVNRDGEASGSAWQSRWTAAGA